MIPKLSVLWDFAVHRMGDGTYLIQLWEEPGPAEPRFKEWKLASGSVEDLTHAMNSLTDELCEGFFPKAHLSKEAKKALKLAKQSNAVL